MSLLFKKCIPGLVFKTRAMGFKTARHKCEARTVL